MPRRNHLSNSLSPWNCVISFCNGAAVPTDAILSTVRSYFDINPTVSVSLIPIKRGASGRTIVRVKTEGHSDLIGIHSTDERPDNDYFVPVGRFLQKTRLNVPEILFENPKRRVVLVQDLGDQDLHSMKDQPFSERLPYYRSAFEQIDRLFYAKTPKELELMPPFDTALYRWEQEYFFDHLVEHFLGMDANALRQSPIFSSLAQRLGGPIARHLVHRDFQSQNIIIHQNRAWLIDFQGMRRGRQEYDLASLIFDPYLNHSCEEREQLLDLWEDISDERPEDTIFRECAAQRLMQALGAYGNILRRRGDEWYRPHIPVAAALLEKVVAGTEMEAPLKPIFETIEDKTSKTATLH